MSNTLSQIKITPLAEDSQLAINGILTRQAQNFLKELHKRFNQERLQLLKAREQRKYPLHFLNETKQIRESNWQVSPIPQALQNRRVEITGPAEAKMIINALNSDAKVFMADFEDSLSPTWSNLIQGQLSLLHAVRGRLEYKNEAGKTYQLNAKTATLVVRPRGLHLEENHFQILNADEQTYSNISGSLFDFALYLFHNAAESMIRGFGPYYYLPKLESHLEARWWNDVFNFAESYLRLPPGCIKATVLIETIPAAFEMEEIIYELREHLVALNAGRWDYIFSLIKKHKLDAKFILPDRDQVTMTTDFMSAYCELLVHTCHKRGAYAIGGMSAFIPNRREPEVTKAALEKVTQDKKREAELGFEGTWVAHPDLVDTAMKQFDQVMGNQLQQQNKGLSNSVHQYSHSYFAEKLLDTKIANSQITETGIRKNISVAIHYMEKWLQGTGAVAIHNLMEDAATAEISRMQLWQWLKHSAAFTTQNGNTEKFSLALLQKYFDEEVFKLAPLFNESKSFPIACRALFELVTSPSPEDFLTLKLMPHIQTLDENETETKNASLGLHKTNPNQQTIQTL